MSELVKLTDKQEQFINEYVKDLNATQAAIRAGYKEEAAMQMGFENLRKLNIRSRIDEILKEKCISADETLKLMSDIAKSNVNDYLTIKWVERRHKIKKPLRDKIEELSMQIQKKRRLQELSDWDEERIDDNFKEISRIEEQILEYHIELEFNPDACIIELSAPELVESAEVDLVKVAKDKENGRIKSFTYTEAGMPKIEFYAADAALVNMAKIHGKFEKDNNQKQPVIKVGFQNTDDE